MLSAVCFCRLAGTSHPPFRLNGSIGVICARYVPQPLMRSRLRNVFHSLCSGNTIPFHSVIPITANCRDFPSLYPPFFSLTAVIHWGCNGKIRSASPTMRAMRGVKKCLLHSVSSGCIPVLSLFALRSGLTRYGSSPSAAVCCWSIHPHHGFGADSDADFPVCSSMPVWGLHGNN